MPRVAIVTGANQGLGYALVQALCRELGGSATVYLTARDPARGQAAVERLDALGLHSAFHRLDVTDEASVRAFGDFVRAEHGGVDIVISNAAARMTKGVPQAAQVRAFIDTNNQGTHRVMRAFAPLMRDGGRFLVVASSFGSLRSLPVAHHSDFDVERCSLEDVGRVMDDYAGLVERGQDREAQWPEWMNIPSKVAQVASMKILAREMREEARRRGILIDAVCPGLIDTDASRPWFADMSSAQTPNAAAVDIVWLATLPAITDEPYGQLVRHRHVLPWT